MGRHRAPRRSSRAIPMIGGGAAALGTAAAVAALQTIPVSSADVYEAGPASSAVLAGETSSAAGPLGIPSIGVVAPGFDRLVSLLGLPTTTAAAPDPTYDVGVWQAPMTSSHTPTPPMPTGSGPTTPPPADPTETPDPTQTPDPTEEPSPTEEPTDPTETPDPTEEPTDPTETPDPTENPDPTETPDPTEEPPPTEEPVDPEPPANVPVAIGESFSVTDAATGAVLYTVTVDAVTLELPCTGPAENGQLLGLQVTVSATSEFALDAADFYVVADDSTVTDPATAAASACLLPDALPAGPLAAGDYRGTVVLDVASPTGSIVHRPDPLQAGAYWTY